MADERGALLRTLAKIAEALDAVGVEYMVTGSVAAGFFSLPRTSADIDIVIDAKDSDRPFLTKVLTEDFLADPDMIKNAFATRSMFNVIDEREGPKIDLIFLDRSSNPGPVLERRREIEIEGTMVKIISPEDLIIAKLLWAKDSRPEMQFRDVHGLLHYRTLDEVYVRDTAAQLGLLELLEEARGERYAT